MYNLVSICCITYNHEKYIRDAIEGFLIQKTDFPMEIIIHDDASTDQTAEIIREYEKKYPELIKPIYQTENQYSKGVRGIDARFTFPKARGKYIAICEGDDYWTDPFKLQKQVDFLESNPEYSLCFHNAIIIDDKYPGIEKLFNTPNQKKTFTIEDVINGWFIASASMLFRRKFLQMPDWFKDIYNGDFALQLLLADKGPFGYIDESMSVYRKNLGGLYYTDYSVDPETIMNHLIDLFKKINVYYNYKYSKKIQQRISMIEYEKKRFRFRKKYPFIKYISLLRYWRFFKRHWKILITR